jgi:hypothetical protein
MQNKIQAKPDKANTFEIRDRQSDKSVRLVWESGLLKALGDYDEKSITPFIETCNRRLINTADISMAMQELLIEAHKLIQDSTLRKTQRGKKLLDSIKSYCLSHE